MPRRRWRASTARSLIQRPAVAMTPTSVSPSHAPSASAGARAVVAEELLGGDHVDPIVRQRGDEERARAAR